MSLPHEGSLRPLARRCMIGDPRLADPAPTVGPAEAPGDGAGPAGPSARTRRAVGWRGWGWIVPALVLGGLLRLWNLDEQILVGDELHAIGVAVRDDAATIATHYRESDASIPLSLWNRMRVVAGAPLTEWWVRLPTVASGLVALVALPLLLAAVERRPRPAFALWLAMSPLLVLYGRIARPHGLAMLLGVAAALLFWLWWRGDRPGLRLPAAVAVLGTLAGWCHLLAGPFFAAMFTFAFVEALVRRRARQELPRLFGLALALACGWMLFLVPALPSLLELLEWNAGAGWVTAGSVAATARMLAGVRWGSAGWLFLVAAAAGWWATFRHDRRWGVYGLVLLVGHVVGILVLNPFAIGEPVVLSRYLIPVVPLLLVWVSRCPSPLPRLATPWAALLLAAAVAAGPLADEAFRKSSMVHAPRYVRFASPRPNLRSGQVPAFYRALAGRQGGAVIEVPWEWLSHFGEVLGAYQEVHGQRMLVAGILPPWGDAVRLRNQLALTPRALLDSPGRWAVLHTRPGLVLRRSFASADADANPATRQLNGAAKLAQRELTAAWGPPHRRSRGLLAWDLERVRRQQERGAERARRRADRRRSVGPTGPRPPGGR